MASENDPIIAALKARIAGFQAALDSYLAAIALDGGSPAEGSAAGVAGVARPKAMDLPVGVFRDKSVKEAIVIYLEAGRRKQTNKEIADGLKRGGIATTSGSFESTVATALFRLKNEGVVLRFDEGWDLAASYPDSLRSRLESREQPRKKKSAKKKAAKAASTKQPKADARPTAPTIEEAPVSEPKLRAV
jgi:hypothetical protein